MTTKTYLTVLVISFVFTLGIVATSCSSDDNQSNTTGSENPQDECAELAPQCIALQQGCVPTDGETAAHCEACPEGEYAVGPNAECVENPLADCAKIAQQCITKQQGCVPTESDTPAHCKMCPKGQYPSGINAQCVNFEGLTSEHDFGTITLAPGEEHNGWCQSWVLNNETELWVNGLEFMTQGGYHHSNWFFVPEGKHSYPDKTPWKNCYSKGFSEIDAALSGGVLYAQSTQVAREFQKFPTGVAVRIPPWSRIIAATHVFNYLPEDLETNLKIAIHTLDPKEVTVKLAPFRMSYTDILIPPKATVEHGGSCDLKGFWDNNPVLSENPFAFKLYYALPHYHSWGNSFRLSVTGGKNDGKQLMNLGAFSSDPFGKMFDPPIDLSDSSSLNFVCGWKNTEDHELKWGLSEGEMCVMLGFAESKIAIDAHVMQTDNVDNTLEVPFSSGACEVLAFPFNQNKDGGIPPEERPQE